MTFHPAIADRFARLSAPWRRYKSAQHYGLSDEQVESALAGTYQFGDRVVTGFVFCHFVLALLLASVYETWALSLVVAGAAAAMFGLSVRLAPRTFVTRVVAGISLQTFVALHIYQMHGLAEMHFFFFTAFTVLIVYCDALAMWPGALLIIGQHVLFAVLHNSGAALYFFEDPLVSVRKLFFHFGIAIVQVALCGVWANHLRRRRLQDAALNEEIVKARRIADAANQSKSHFLSNMSHEIRTPMTAILGFTDILLGQASNEEARDAARIIKRNGDYLLSLLNDILDLSKIEAGCMQVEKVPVDIQQLMRDVRLLMRVRADAKGLPLDLEYVTPAPPLVLSDPTRLRQILINLIGNAIKFTEAGGVRVSISAARQDGAAFAVGDDGPVTLRFSVEDSGIGMTPEQLANLFRPFTQADASVTRRFGGTGLGLTICKRLANLLGGDIVAESRFGEGSRMTLEITAEVSQTPQPVERRPSEDRAATPSVEPELRIDARVLLAEDGPDNQRLISYLLRKAGVSVSVVENGRLAVETALAAQECGQPFDVILMDMQMPVLDGYSATRELRAAGYGGRIAALTAYAMRDDRRKCLEAGCDDYASKPIGRHELCRLVLGEQSASTGDSASDPSLAATGAAV